MPDWKEPPKDAAKKRKSAKEISKGEMRKLAADIQKIDEQMAALTKKITSGRLGNGKLIEGEREAGVPSHIFNLKPSCVRINLAVLLCRKRVFFGEHALVRARH